MTSRWLDGCFCGLLVLLAALAYSPALECSFVNYDDPGYVTENRHVAAGVTLSGIVYAWTTFDTGNWIPLTWLTYLVDATLFGNRPLGFHAMNVFWHAGNSSLLYLVLRRMTGAPVRSALAAAFFAVHPLHVESVAWISERKDVLSAFWMLMTLLAYERYARLPQAGRLVWVCAALGLGLLAKSMLVTVPVLLMLLDFWPLQRISGLSSGDGKYPARPARFLVLEKIPLFLLAVLDGLITMLAQHSAKSIAKIDDVSWLLRAGNAVRAVGWYLWKTASPTELCAFYPHPHAAISWRGVIASGIALVLITVWAAASWKKDGYRLTGWLWFIISLLPVIGLLQVGTQAQADRYAYIPHIGLFVMLVWTAARACEPWPSAQRLGLAAAALAIMCGLLLTRLQAETWRNSETLWRHALAVNSENYIAHLMLGKDLSDRHQLEQAERHWRRSLELMPSVAPTIFNLGQVHARRAEWDQALAYFQWAQRIDPDDPKTAAFIQEVQQKLGDTGPGKPRSYVPGDPAKSQLKRGLAQARQHDMPAALRCFEAALKLEPGYPDAHNNAGLALYELKRFDESERHYRQALTAEPRNSDFHVNFATLLMQLQRWDEAREHFQTALQINPSDVEAQSRLAWLRQHVKQP